MTNILKTQKWNASIVVLTLLLLVSSVIHRMQMDLPNDGYVRSIFVHIEMLSMIVLLLMNLINAVVFLKHLIQRNWRKLLITLAVGACSILLMIVSMQIDSPTLIYMT